MRFFGLKYVHRRFYKGRRGHSVRVALTQPTLTRFAVDQRCGDAIFHTTIRRRSHLRLSLAPSPELSWVVVSKVTGCGWQNAAPGLTGSAFDESEEVGVQGIGINGQHPMRKAGIGLQRAVLQKLNGLVRSICDRNDLIVLTMQDQRRHTDRLQVLGLVGFRKGLDAVVVGLCAAHHALTPPIVNDPFMYGRTFAVETIERPSRNVAEELRAIGGKC